MPLIETTKTEWGAEEPTPNEGTRKNSKENPNEMEISNLPDKEFKEILIKMLNKLENAIEKLRALQ